MKKIIVFLAVMCLCAAFPAMSFTEDKSTVRLARTIYALAGHEDYETKLAIGTVVMNRVENAWFADTLGEVLQEQHQFPAGSRYDDESLQAAHAVLSGERTLSASALYYQPVDAAEQWNSAKLVDTVGGYGFYSDNGRI